MSVLTHLLLNHKSASLLFSSYPLDSFSTSHHSNFPDTHTSSFFHFHFFVYVFSLARFLPPLTILHCVVLEPVVLVHLFHSVCFFLYQCERESTLLLLSSTANSKVNQFSSTPSPITEHITVLALWTTVFWERQFVVNNVVQNCHFNLRSLNIWSAFFNKIKNLNPTRYTTLE